MAVNPYERGTSFRQFQEDNPTTPLQGQSVDQELDQVSTASTALATALSQIQRDDGKLKNLSVHKDAFSPDALLLMAGSFRPRGDWVTTTDYEVSDLVNNASETYVCMEPHTSGTFSNDLSNGKWMTLSVDSAISEAFATAAAASAAAAELALDEITDLWLGRKAVLPTLDNDGNPLQAGAFCQLSTDDALYFYTGSAWIVGTASSQIIEYEFTAIDAQTVFTGADDNANTLAYSVNRELVFIDGVKQPRDSYTATNGTTVTLNTGTTAGQLVTVMAYVSIATTDFDAKADKVVGATSGNFAGLDANGNLVDSGSAPSDFVEFATGTAMVFFQAAAPTGWTKSTTHNDKALRVVSGAGGGFGGTAAFSTPAHSLSGGATTLSTAQMPSHTHTMTTQVYIGDSGGAGYGINSNSASATAINNNTAGSGSSHSHSIAGSITTPQYIDVIVCTKD